LYAGTGAKEFDDGALLERSEALLNATAIPRHDAILLGCDGVPSTPSPTAIQAMFDFTGRGGLLWLTHDGFPWLEQGPPPWNALATFSTDSTIATGTTVLVDQSSPHGQAFADWSVAAGASAMPGKLQLQYARSSCQTADPALTRQVLILDPASGIDGVQMFTWDSAMGGRVVFSDVHLSGSLVGGQGDTYPDDCPVAVSAQETAMMLEMFDTPTCVN
jgi:hypothetical protein